jgi:3-oxoacyl-[acyl-carrier-protein] synthase II
MEVKQVQDPAGDLCYTPNEAGEAGVKVVLSNSFGMGGHNACIMLRRYRRDP